MPQAAKNKATSASLISSAQKGGQNRQWRQRRRGNKRATKVTAAYGGGIPRGAT